MSVPSLVHWYRSAGAPVAATPRLTGRPVMVVVSTGPVVMAGGFPGSFAVEELLWHPAPRARRITGSMIKRRIRNRCTSRPAAASDARCGLGIPPRLGNSRNIEPPRQEDPEGQSLV